MDRLARKYRISGLVGGVDAVWRPGAHDAAVEWETLRLVPVPVPAPDGGRAPTDLDAGSITIEID
ncbi:hypothetical protein [Microbacterium sp. NPDC055683]